MPPSAARPPDHIHVQPGKLRHGTHNEGLWSLVASQRHRGQAQGWPRLAPASLPPSELWDWGRGEMLLVTGVPPGLPTRAGGTGIAAAHAQRARPRASHSQRYSQGFQQLAPIPGMRTRQRRGSELPEQPHSSCLMAAQAPHGGKRSCLLAGGMLGRGNRSDLAARSWEKSIPPTWIESF